MDITPTVARTLGGILELVGLFLVAVGIYRLHLLFEGAPLTEMAKGFVRRARDRMEIIWDRIRKRPRPINLQIESAGSSHAAGSLRVSKGKVGPGPNKTLEEKVGWLLSMVDRLQDADHELSDRIDDGIKAERAQRETAVRQEQEARAQEATELRDDIRKLAVGDLRAQALGVFLFMVGAALQVWSPEIARLL